MEPRIDGVFLQSADPQALSRWYADNLGVEARSRADGVELSGPSGREWDVSLEVDDLDAVVDQLRAAGVLPQVDPIARQALLRDPAGHTVLLRQPVDVGFVRAVDQEQEPVRRVPARALALAVVAVVAVVLAVVLSQSDDDQWEPGEDVGLTEPTTEKPVITTESPAKPQTTTAELTLSGDWEVIAYADGELVRIELDSAKVTRTPVDELPAEPPISLLAAPDRVLVRSWEGGTGVQVPDGEPARPNHGGMMLPGPEPDQLWTQQSTTATTLLTPETLNGRKAGPSLRLPPGFYVTVSDERGGVLVEGVNGTYVANRSGVRRVTDGAVLAIGRGHLLTEVCDERARCRNEVVDRTDGTVRQLGTRFTKAHGMTIGLISVDGRYAALLAAKSDGEPAPHLVDLRTGRSHVLEVDVADIFAPSGMAWSPDGSRLLVVSGGDIVVVDPVSRRVRSLGARIPAVEAVAVRG